MSLMGTLTTREDYGKPVYVEAHGGKNHVIMYRSRTNPELAIEFFFRFVFINLFLLMYIHEGLFQDEKHVS